MVAVAPKPLPLVRGGSEGADCLACPFNGQRKVEAIGPSRPKFIIVGEGPGENERRSGLPFVGASGSMVNQALKSIGVAREDVWITNALLCTPQGPAGHDGNKELARKCCAGRLERELKERPGLPVLALGAVAARSLIATKFSIMQMAGALFRMEDGRCVIPSIHPAAILRGQGDDKGGAHAADMLYINLIYDAAKVKGLADGSMTPFEASIKVCYTPKDALAAMERLEKSAANKHGFLACDTETNSLVMKVARIKAIGLGTPDFAMSLPSEVYRKFPAVKARLQKLLLDWPLVFHNKIYDKPVLRTNGFRLREEDNSEDTMLAHHASFPGLPHGLQQVVCQFDPVPAWKSDFRGGEQTTHELLEYNAKDTLTTARVWPTLQVCVKKSQAEQIYQVDKTMAEIAARMHEVGVPFDFDLAVENEKHFVAEKTKYREVIEEEATKPEIREKLFDRLAFEQAKKRRKGTGDKTGRNKSNKEPEPPDIIARHKIRLAELERLFSKGKWGWKIGSPLHVAAYLRAKGLPLYTETKTGQLSTSAKVLEALGYHPEIEGLINYREADKMLSTFVLPHWRSALSYEDGRMRPRWGVHAITGRMTCEDPQCFTADAEFLTPQGWKRVSEIGMTDRVAQFTPEGMKVDFVSPTAVISKRSPTVRVRSHRAFDFRVSPDHRFLGQTRRSGLWKEWPAESWRPDHNVPTAGHFSFGHQEDVALLRFVAAAQADGYFNGSGWSFSFKKRRKFDRLIELLGDLCADFSYSGPDSGGVYKVYLKKNCGLAWAAHSLLGEKKTFGSWLLGFSKPSVEAFLDELFFWDGSLRTRTYFTTKETNVDWVQALAALTGRTTKRWSTDKASPLQKKTLHHVAIRKDHFVSSSNVEVLPDEEAEVFCVSVPSTYLLVRQNGRVIVAGNCMNVPKGRKGFPCKVCGKVHAPYMPNLRKQVRAPKGRRFVGFDMAQLEARVIALYSGDEWLCNVFSHPPDKFGPGDIHTQVALIPFPKFFEYEKAERAELREFVKPMEYGGLYGGAVDTLYQNILQDNPHVKKSDVAKVVTLLQQTLRGVERWHNELVVAVSRPPYVLREPVLGRWRKFPLGQAPMTDVYNFPVQSMGRSILLVGYMRLWAKLKKVDRSAEIIIDGHDAVVIECSEDRVPEVRALVRECFSQEHTYNGTTIKFPAEDKDGETWADV